MAKMISLKDAPAEYVTAFEQVQVTGQPQIIERDGKPFVVVIPYDEYEEFASFRQAERDKTWMEEQHQILMREYAAFEQMKPELLKTRKGKFVAIHNGELVDFDDDENTLTERVYGKFGYQTILMTEVTETERVYHVNSPKLVR